MIDVCREEAVREQVQSKCELRSGFRSHCGSAVPRGFRGYSFRGRCTRALVDFKESPTI